jgi:hypothetical protein
MDKMYKLISHPLSDTYTISIVGTQISFLPDPANTDYQEYLEWVSQGNEPLPPDPIPEPEPLTAQQKLEASGLTVEELKELLGL